MPLDVIGAGFGRTGTLSLKIALEQLGFSRCYHMVEVFQNPAHVATWHDAALGKSVDWEQLYQGYRAAVDWPPCAFWRDYAERYPRAKVILSVRSAQSWWESVDATIFATMRTMLAADTTLPDGPIKAQGRMVRQLIIDGTFHGRLNDSEYAKSIYERHNTDVIASLPPERLLVYPVGSGWEPLCKFLNVPVPATPYPKVNDRDEFQQRVAAMRPPANS